MPFFKLSRNKRGSGLIEYSILVGLIGMLSIGSIVIMGTTVNDVYCTVANRISGDDASCYAAEAEQPAMELLVKDNLGSGNGLIGTVSSVAAPQYSVTDSSVFYCIDLEGDVMDGVSLETEVRLSDPDDPAMGAFLYNPHNLDLINYILNQDYAAQGYTRNNVQDAVWYFTDDAFTIFNPDVNAIVQDAEANGEGFVPGDGDLVGVILAPIQLKDADGNDTTNYQNFVYGVPKALLGL
jgi:Flp pilus assembly pilin Flp